MLKNAAQVLVYVGLIFSGLAVAQTSEPLASPSVPTSLQQTQSFGMVGLAIHQSAQVNLLNPGTLLPGATTASGTAGPCPAQVTFLDDTGKVLKSGALSVPAGQSASLDLSRDTDLTATVQRVEVRALIQTPLTPVANPGPTTAVAVALFCTLVPTLEVFDNNTGNTLVILESPRVASGPLGVVTPLLRPNLR